MIYINYKVTGTTSCHKYGLYGSYALKGNFHDTRRRCDTVSEIVGQIVLCATEAKKVLFLL
jgi:hypothetical protein